MLTTTLSGSIAVADGISGSNNLSKPIALSFSGSAFSYFTSFAISTSPTSLVLPVAPVQFIYIKNTGYGLLTVTLTPLILLAAPASPTLSSVAAGTLAATTYYVIITYVNQFGETIGSTEASQACLINHLVRVT